MDPSGTNLTPNCGTQDTKDAWQIDGIPQEGYDLCFAQFSGSSKETGFVPKFNMTWNWADDHMVYFTYSQGFRNGGANGGRRQSVFATGGEYDTYESDTLINYEIGTKNTFADGLLQANITLYHMQWEDIQIQTEDPQPAIFATGIINFPNADIDGIEASMAWQPTDSLNINGTLGYNNAKMAEDAVLWAGTENEDTIPKGTRLPLMPKWKFSLNARYDFDGQLWKGTPFVMGTWTFNGDSLNSLGVGSTIIQDPPLNTPSFNILNLRFGVEGEGWTAALFVDNVFNEYAINFYNTRQTQLRATVLPPRVIGINFHKDFDW
jgi:outer membrane receptor protein involved in Fe transport